MKDVLMTALLCGIPLIPVWQRAGGGETVYDLLLLVLLSAITCEDWRSRRIPRRLTWALWVLGVPGALWAPCAGYRGIKTSVFGMLTGAALPLLAALPLGCRGVGGGDVCLLAAGGWMLGAEGILRAMAIACASSLPEACVAASEKRRTFPWGPYLCLGIWVAHLGIS